MPESPGVAHCASVGRWGHFRVPLVFTCDLKGLLFLCPCQSESTISCQGDPVDGAPPPTETPICQSGFKSSQHWGTWLGVL